jgi:hypothetical protein
MTKNIIQKRIRMAKGKAPRIKNDNLIPLEKIKTTKKEPTCQYAIFTQEVFKAIQKRKCASYAY